ncbi:hypothetical protein ASG17_00085 [Brevundimonas sp. Leaf363]|uniref:type II toxin-antitoxin system VapC family toxin n=1 Tax=Brevundimonas sp. Leaf363 TaxID=1736353 RepID=UPI0007013914|nr:type II toxin-antitoxin system VapC family toxin [Brevundimonas sp. Leaf363]KQS57184.1 hypothetical protein ASG17_00085 [Brevundimonas sp. Leaf363]
MIVCLDTSVLIAAFTREKGSPRALALLAEACAWRVSDWAAAEFAGAIRVKARRGELDVGQIEIVEATLNEMIAAAGAAIHVHADDHPEARRLIIENGLLRAPDALHLAIAQRIGAQLATFDTNLVRAAEAVGVPVMRP